jgi:hypothetical protein
MDYMLDIFLSIGLLMLATPFFMKRKTYRMRGDFRSADIATVFRGERRGRF